MSTNPNNAVGTNAAYSGRTSVKAFNDILGVFNGRGLLSGWAVSPGSGMTVLVGGNGSTRDVAIAENNTGDRTTINNISGEPVSITIPEAPVSNSRYDLIVAYVDNPPVGSSTVADNPSAVGIIVVSGSVAGSPTLPDESTIRDAITVDGGTGATAYYVVLASVLVAAGTTDITSNLITAGQRANVQDSSIGTDQIANGAVTTDKVDWATIGSNCISEWLASAATYTSDSAVAQIPALPVTTNGGDVLCIASIAASISGTTGAIRAGYANESGKQFRVGTLLPAHGTERCSGSYILRSMPAGTYSFRFYVTLDSGSGTITLPENHQFSLTVVELPKHVLK